jgi:hypothetical protein
MGLVVAPSCNDCHGVHDIKRSVDKDSHSNHANIAESCGKCHVGIEDTYNESVHGKLLAQGDKRGPVCTDCHSAHDIEKPATAHFKAGSDQSCGKCHQDRLEHYPRNVPRQGDGARPAQRAPRMSRPATTVTGTTTCSRSAIRAHGSRRAGSSRPAPNATPGRTRISRPYQPHANPLDRVNYPILNKVFLFMTALLVGTFAFFGVHTAVLAVPLGLSLSERLEEVSARPIAQQRVDDVQFTRFTPFERFLHLLVVTSFLLLVITGMPLKFYYTGMGQGASST